MRRNTSALFPFQNWDYLLPVPATRNSLAARGFNQSAILAKEISKGTSEPSSLKCRILAVKGKGKKEHQAGLGRAQRLRNVKGRFYLKSSVVGKRILLIDDVLTTGATVNEIFKVLKTGGAESVDLFTLACSTRWYESRISNSSYQLNLLKL